MGETAFLMAAMALCLGWSIVERTLAPSEQLVITGTNHYSIGYSDTLVSLTFYMSAGIGVAYGGDSAIFYLVLTAFLRTVIGFVILVGAQATIARVHQRNSSDNRSIVDQQRNALVMMNLHYRLDCL